MPDLLKHLKKVLEGLGESKYGIIIKDTREFVSFLRDHTEFDFQPGEDVYNEEFTYPPNMWDSVLDGFRIMHVCCTDSCVITYRLADENGDNYLPDVLDRLEDLEKKLNDTGFECEIGVLEKTCSCT